MNKRRRYKAKARRRHLWIRRWIRQCMPDAISVFEHEGGWCAVRYSDPAARARMRERR